jgi:hypothetical protein
MQKKQQDGIVRVLGFLFVYFFFVHAPGFSFVCFFPILGASGGIKLRARTLRFRSCEGAHQRA